jgi:hypothetical protein
MVKISNGDDIKVISIRSIDFQFNLNASPWEAENDQIFGLKF